MVNTEKLTTTEKVVPLDTATLSSQRFLQVDPRISKGVQFTTDGKAVRYPITENGVDNGSSLIDGAPGRQITHFNSEQITSFSLVVGWKKSRRASRSHGFRRGVAAGI
jgi:hypothetical protein